MERKNKTNKPIAENQMNNNEIFHTENIEDLINFQNKDDESTKYQDPITGAHFKYEDVFLRLQYLQQQQKYGAINTETCEEEDFMDDVFDEIPLEKPGPFFSGKKVEKPKIPIKDKKANDIKNIYLGQKVQSPSKSTLHKDHKKDSNSLIKEKNKGKLSQLQIKPSEHSDDSQKLFTKPCHLLNNWIIKTLDNKSTTKCQDEVSKEAKSPVKNKPMVDGCKLFSSL